MTEYIHTPLFKLFVGVLLALLVHLYKKRNGTPHFSDIQEEFKLLIIPAALAAAGMVAAGEDYASAAEGGLIVLATALGLNSSKK